MRQIKRARRELPATLLACYLTLAWLPFLIARLQGDTQDAPLRRALAIFAVLTFLAWRVWRGGTISWTLLMLASLWNLAAIAFGAVAPWTFSIYWQAAIAAIQLALLFSPALRHRLGRPAQPLQVRRSSPVQV